MQVADPALRPDPLTWPCASVCVDQGSDGWSALWYLRHRVANVLVTLRLGENVLAISEVTSDMSVQVVLTMEVSGAEGIGELVAAVGFTVAGVEDLTIMMSGVAGGSIKVETVLGTGCGRMTMTVVEAKRVFLNSIFSSVIFL